MKFISKTTAIFAGLFLVFASSLTFSADVVERPQNPQPQMSSFMPLEIQKRLTDIGHTVLDQVLHHDDFDMSKSKLFEEVYPLLEPLLPQARYSTAASWKPSNLIRWAFSSTDPVYIAARKNQMIAIIALGWALTDLAKKQGDFFERGSFSIIDPSHRLTNFLLNYVKLTTGYADPQAVPFALTTCNFAYRRDPTLNGSSHHKGRCPESQFGIDVRFEPSDVVMKFFPFDRTHGLFAMLNIGNQEEPLLFLKLEPIGMGSVPAMGAHGLEFLDSKSFVAREARREKDIKEPILTSFKIFQNTAGLDGEFKTIRAMYLEAQRLLLQTAPRGSSAQNAASAAAKLEESIIDSEIGAFHPVYSKDKDPQYASAIQEKSKAFLDIVDGQYRNGNNHLRVGNEVILDLRGYKKQ